MTNEEFDRRIEKLTARDEALSESVGLLRGSVSDLTAVVDSLAEDTKRQKQRDRQCFLALSDLLRSWAGEDGQDE